MLSEWATLKIAGAVTGAVGTYAAIVAKKDVSRLEAYAIFLAGVSFSIFLPSLIAKHIILRYGLVNDFDTLFGIVGVLGLIFGLIGYKFVVGIYKIAGLFERSPIPFLQRLLGLWSGRP